jgi:alginate O-acetyltransferase complex protein AlgI
MLFNSLHFIIFFPAVVIIYFSLSHKYRWILLLSASYYFYMCWKVEYIVLIIASTIVDYISAQRIYHSSDNKKKKYWLTLSLLVNLGILFSFKYFNFVNDNLRELFNYFNIFYNIKVFDVLLPVGISFYTFQTMSYTIDVYYGKLRPEKHFGRFALYVSFFPQLVAGPIERATRLLPQFYNKIKPKYHQISSGLRLMLWGFFKKIVIADNLAYFVNTVYNDVEIYQGFPLIWATLFFSFQIYCDFSGYSDIAIGAARILGFDLMTNFKMPYFSKSIGEFWHRWHISLSTWFRDYVYIPLGGSRVVKWRWYYNLFITFVISGIWHGANWTFIFWGMTHGMFLILGIVLFSKQKILSNKGVSGIIKTLFVFVLVYLSWILFRANNLSDAAYIFKNLLNINFNNLIGLATIEINKFIIYLVLIVTLLIGDFILFHKIEEKIKYKKQVVYVINILLLLSIFLFGVFEEQAFIYFQF